MPWCPNCRFEYKEGMLKCADCGADLVDSYDEIVAMDEAKQEELEKEAAIRAAAQNDLDVEEYLARQEELKTQAMEAHDAANYMKASDKAENYKSSGFALTLVGGAGLIVMVLYILGIIDFHMADNIRLISIIVFTLLFASFLYMGIRSFADAKKQALISADEEQTDEEIREWFLFNFSAETIDDACAIGADDNEDETNYFARNEYMKKVILEKFPDVDRAYLENLLEDLYSETYEH